MSDHPLCKTCPYWVSTTNVCCINPGKPEDRNGSYPQCREMAKPDIPASIPRKIEGDVGGA